jgi:hypothetical protein
MDVVIVRIVIDMLYSCMTRVGRGNRSHVSCVHAMVWYWTAIEVTSCANKTA